MTEGQSVWRTRIACACAAWPRCRHYRQLLQSQDTISMMLLAAAAAAASYGAVDALQRLHDGGERWPLCRRRRPGLSDQPRQRRRRRGRNLRTQAPVHDGQRCLQDPSFFDETVNCIQLSQAMRIPSFVSGKGHVTCMPLRPGYGIARAHISQSTTPNEYTSACSDAADIARRAAAPLQSHTKMASTQRLH